MGVKMDKPDKWSRTGTFILPSGKEIFGELRLKGANTALNLRDKDDLGLEVTPVQTVYGVLHDLTKVSLLECITLQTSGSMRRGEKFHSARIFPHFVLYGGSHFPNEYKTITHIDFAMDDASTLFYDFDAFGCVFDSRSLIDAIVEANKLGRKVETGEDAIVLYFAGRSEILSVDTVLGRISASHRPSVTTGGPAGVGLDNTIYLSVAFPGAISFDDAISRLCTLLRYFGMLIGRPQKLLKLTIVARAEGEVPAHFAVYWCMPPNRKRSKSWSDPHPADVLLPAVQRPGEFVAVLKEWLSRESDWQMARVRLAESLAEQSSHNIDRLIRSANMFDILPVSAVPINDELPEELVTAKINCQKIFSILPPSSERNSILSALGRIGKSNLKKKIRYRISLIAGLLGERFPELELVTDEAVDCRNYFVHGGVARFKYAEDVSTTNFLTSTLEFVFAASDLYEAGWDVRAWAESGTTMSHPFGQYRVAYIEGLKRLKELLHGAL